MLALAISRRLRHSPVAMDLERDGNLIEAGVWFLLAIVMFFHALRSRTQVRPTCFMLVVALAVFGASDVVEARTGAWWKPWWLFVWKAACLIALFFGFVRYYRIEKSKKQRMNTDAHR
jgi:hypothetical protein